MTVLTVLLAAASAATTPLDAVVLIHQGRSTCAGAFVDPSGTVLTAYHCVASGGRPRVRTRSGETAVGRVVNAYPAADLAVLKVELSPEAFLPLRPESPLPGEVVHALGHPLGTLEPGGFYQGTLRWSQTAGVISAVGAVSLQISAPVNPGNSGGPVVDDAGRLVGIVSRRLVGDGLGFATRVEVARSLLEEGERGWSALGGTWAIELLGAGFEGPDGTLSGGGRVEAAVRDRVFATLGVAMAPGARWDSVRFGKVRWTAVEARAGLRQRFGRGPWSGRLDLGGGVAWEQTVTGSRDLSTDVRIAPVPIVGGAAGLRAVAVDLAWTLPAADLRAALVLRWPGVVGVF